MRHVKAEDEGRRRGRRRAALALVTMFLVGGPGLGSVVLASWHSARERSIPILGVVSQVGSPRYLPQNAQYDTAPPQIECDYKARFTVGGATYVASGTLINQTRYHLAPQAQCQYSAGDSIKVFYDPNDPSVSTLGLRPLTGMMYLGVVSLVVTALGLFVLIRSVRRLRAG